MSLIMAGIHKMLVTTANREDPDLGLHCLSRPFWQDTSIRKFRTFIIWFIERILFGGNNLRHSMDVVNT